MTSAKTLKDYGIRQVAENNKEFIAAARATAKLICEAKGEVTADDVRQGCPLMPKHPNAWGGVFIGKQFKWTGKIRESKRPTRHCGVQRVWRLA